MGMVHNDLCLENIFFSGENNNLSSFHQINFVGSNESLFQSERRFNSYISPEILNKEKQHFYQIFGVLIALSTN
jgi:hypothetical protein